MRRWGGVYVLILIFVAAWVGQLVAMTPKIAKEGQAEFWSATFENWQSEFLQLAFQAIVIVAFARRFFKVSTDDHDRLERKVDVLLDRTAAND